MWQTPSLHLLKNTSPSCLPLPLGSLSFNSPLNCPLQWHDHNHWSQVNTILIHFSVVFSFCSIRTSSNLLRFPDGSEPSSLSFPESPPSSSSSRKISSYEGTPRSSSCLISSFICGWDEMTGVYTMLNSRSVIMAAQLPLRCGLIFWCHSQTQMAAAHSKLTILCVFHQVCFLHYQ